jgi:hypothetical protein
MYAVDTGRTSAVRCGMRSRPSPAVLIALLALVVAVGLPAEHAVAAALTPKSVKKIARKVADKEADKEIAKKAPGLSVAHASSADTLGGIPPGGFVAKGPVTLSMSSIAWANAQPTAVTIYRMPTEVQLYAPVGLQLFTYPVSIPVQLGGAPVTLASLRYCYAGSAGAHLTSDRVTQSTFEGGAGTVVGAAIVTPSLDLSDSACRTIAVNRVLGAHDQISLQVGASWNTANAVFRLGVVTATYTPS